MPSLLTFLIRLVLLATGLVFAASLLVVMGFVAALWALRYGWARLTGRPVTPFVVRIDPFAGFGRAAGGRWQAAPSASPAEPVRPGPRPELADVTDVEAKPPRA